ncbi:hypothetical protein [Desulfovibrio sp. MES5]|uniref:hypothetical protein n=1 Tax=Desulfovibrio sp. MES5 TaxID=1899016 RepID=UPI0025C022DD|nr:hypothetical protein [Desulfovibrio sp. MES5]
MIGLSDGDTITVLRDERQPIKIHLHGIDCPKRSKPGATAHLKRQAASVTEKS